MKNQLPPVDESAGKLTQAVRPSADRLLEFKTIVDCGSITQAAKQLKQTRPTLSRRFGELEKLLGVRLLQRTTRQLYPTVAGNELYLRAVRIVAEIDNAWDSARYYSSEPCGPLRIGVPEGEMAAEPFFLEFATEFPKIDLDVHVIGQDVDLRSSGIDVAFQFGTVNHPDLIAKKLFVDERLAMATRAFLNAEGFPSTPQQITDYKCIVYRDSKGIPELNWPMTNGSHIEVRPWLLTNSFRLMLQAVHAGLGVGLVSKAEKRKNAELVELFPGQIQKSEPFSLVYVERELQLPHVRAFIERAIVYWKEWIEHW